MGASGGGGRGDDGRRAAPGRLRHRLAGPRRLGDRSGVGDVVDRPVGQVHADRPELVADRRRGPRGRRPRPVPGTAADGRHADLPPASPQCRDGAPDPPRGGRDPGSSASPLAQVSIDDHAINVAAVDPATYRNYNPDQVAQFQQEWNRIARGEMALRPSSVGRCPGTASSGWGARRRAADPRRRLRAADPPGGRDRQRQLGEDARHAPGNALLVSTGIHTPLSIRKPIQRIVGGQASVQRIDAAARFGLDPSVAQIARLIGTTPTWWARSATPSSAVATSRRDPAWVASHISPRWSRSSAPSPATG